MADRDAFGQRAAELVGLAAAFHRRGWMLGTGGNLSAVVSRDPLRLAITRSGVDKGSLSAAEILEVDGDGTIVAGAGRASDETRIHLALVLHRGAGAVVHTHSVWATILSDAHAAAGGLALESYEMLKGLAGVRTHEHREWVPILPNAQDYGLLSREIAAALRRHPAAHGLLLRGHGLYTWGDDLAEAKRHAEVLEFLLEVAGRLWSAGARKGDRAMATVRIPSENRVLTEAVAVRARLRDAGILYDRWEPARSVSEDAPAEAILRAYAPEIERLKKEGGYVTADVIDVKPETPGLDAMLAKFSREHWHDEDEVRFIIKGRGLFHIRPRAGAVIAIEVGPGDLLRVPSGTWHWFDLCADRRIRAIRLFQDPAGWTPHYTESGAEQGFEPVCLGPSQIPVGAPLA